MLRLSFCCITLLVPQVPYTEIETYDIEVPYTVYTVREKPVPRPVDRVQIKYVDKPYPQRYPVKVSKQFEVCCYHFLLLVYVLIFRGLVLSGRNIRA